MSSSMKVCSYWIFHWWRDRSLSMKIILNWRHLRFNKYRKKAILSSPYLIKGRPFWEKWHHLFFLGSFIPKKETEWNCHKSPFSGKFTARKKRDLMRNFVNIITNIPTLLVFLKVCLLPLFVLPMGVFSPLFLSSIMWCINLYLQLLREPLCFMHMNTLCLFSC